MALMAAVDLRDQLYVYYHFHSIVLALLLIVFLLGETEEVLNQIDFELPETWHD